MQMTESACQVGQRYGFLIVAAIAPKPMGQKGRHVEVRCDCGTVKVVRGRSLLSGAIKSCGCYNARSNPGNRIHGMSRTPTYTSWTEMHQRCTNPHAASFKEYGARGISVCARWQSFENFLADMGERPQDKTLDRYPNVSGNYEPGNCRWATASEQARNTRRNIFATFGDVTKCLRDWCSDDSKAYGRVLYYVGKRGYTPEAALRRAGIVNPMAPHLHELVVARANLTRPMQPRRTR
jgi:hypothetical protein